MKRINEDQDLKLQILVSGSHMSDYHGATWKEIEEDGFTINRKVTVNLSDDTPSGIANSVSNFIAEFSTALTELKPDALVILGDRFEAFSIAVAATMLRVPIVHIHGGEITAGAMDDSLRHAISKMSHLHFTAAEVYRKRVIQLGENPETVFNVGATGIEVINHLNFMTRDDLEKYLELKLDGNIFLITYHPETLNEKKTEACIKEVLEALSEFKEEKFIFTQANADIDGQIINESINQFVSQHQQNACIKASLGQVRYLSLMANSDVVIGNSSSGIIEAPAMGVPTVNIGDRQSGRLRAETIIDCKIDKHEIQNAIKKALSKDMQVIAKKLKNNYRKYNASEEIVERIKSAAFDIKKKFYDIPFEIPEERGRYN